MIDAGPRHPTAETSARFVFSDAEPDVSFRCRLDAGRTRRCSSPVEFAALAEGVHTFGVRAVDRRGSVSAESVHRWTIDLARPPRPVIADRPDELSSSDRARFAFAEPEARARFECSLDGATVEACTSPAEYGSLADGEHRFAVTAHDEAGNASAPAGFAWTVDATPPSPPMIEEAPAEATAAGQARLEFAHPEGGVRFTCLIDGDAAPCQSPATYDVAVGPHRFAVTATDLAGNESAPATRDWTVDTDAPPAPQIASHPQERSARAGAAFVLTDADPAATFFCRIDDGPSLPCPSYQTYPGPLGAGTHRLSVHARDPAGNRSPPAEFAWRFDPDLYRATVRAEDGLLGYWRLGEAGWAPAADELGRNPGAYSGGTTLGAGGAILDDPDLSTAFDGVSGEALLPSSRLSSDGTLEGWFRWRSGVVVMRDHTGGGGWILAFDVGGKLGARAGGLTLTTAVEVGAARDGRWHHLALIKRGRTVSLYLDGKLPLGGSRTFASDGAASMPPWHLMNNGTFAEQYSAGEADEVAIYGAALSDIEIAEHHRLGRGP